jgi:phosphoesterase RecJ-like protein
MGRNHELSMDIRWDRFVEIVRQHQTFLLTSHMRPDCDALGSELGMAEILRAVGKDAWIINGQATPPHLAFLDPASRIRSLDMDLGPHELPRFDLLMVLDTAAWAQLGPMAQVLRSTDAKKIVIDHHVSGDDLGAEVFKDATCDSTGRLVLQAARALDVALTPEMATPLFAAMVTDTGWFRFNSTTGETLRAAAQLVDAGASPSTIYADLYEQDTEGRVRLRGVILARIQRELEGRLVHTFVLKDDFQRCGASPSDTEDVINMTLAIRGTEFAVILVEQPKGGFKASFRSRGASDCSQIAEQFGGGGHRAAAGAFLAGSLEEVQPRVLDAVRKALR